MKALHVGVLKHEEKATQEQLKVSMHVHTYYLCNSEEPCFGNGQKQNIYFWTLHLNVKIGIFQNVRNFMFFLWTYINVTLILSTSFFQLLKLPKNKLLFHDRVFPEWKRNSVNSANWGIWKITESWIWVNLKNLFDTCVFVALWYHLCLLCKRLWVRDSDCLQKYLTKFCTEFI